jgi:hypothetical protein
LLHSWVIYSIQKGCVNNQLDYLHKTRPIEAEVGRAPPARLKMSAVCYM